MSEITPAMRRLMLTDVAKILRAVTGDDPVTITVSGRDFDRMIDLHAIWATGVAASMQAKNEKGEPLSAGGRCARFTVLQTTYVRGD